MNKKKSLESMVSELKTLCTKIQNDPSNEQLHRDFIHLLKNNNLEEHSYFDSFQIDLYNALGILFLNDRINLYHLDGFASRQLRLKYRIDATIEPTRQKELLRHLGQDSLFLAYLEKRVNVDYDFEVFLVKLRRFLLLEYRSRLRLDRQYFRLTAALAHQSFNNEYIFNEEAGEPEVLNEMEKDLGNVFSIDDVKVKEVHLLVLSMYRPLFKLPIAARVAQIPLDVFSEPVRPCIERMLHEPLEERRLKQDIPSFGTITCLTSKAVRAQYEENPYPRWFNIANVLKPLDVKLKKAFPGFKSPLLNGDERLRILVPGCGTGRHPLVLAAANPDADIVAFDLSKESLAYGIRMAARLNINNVTFLHGDLLEIPETGQYFHHIDCIGVLHHLEKPEAGWCALERVTLPGGTLHIGVYSKVARMMVTFIRNEISRLNLEPGVEEMKKFRQMLLTHPRYKAIRSSLISSLDFFSLSSFRDMFFHAREYQYTISGIKKIIESLNLKFLGFQSKNAILTSNYRKRFPEDYYMTSFENWRQFEKAYVGTGCLFDFWLQKSLQQ